MEKLLTLTEVMNLGLSERLIRTHLKVVKVSYNYYNPKQPVRLYRESDVLTLLKNASVSATIKLKLSKHEQISERYIALHRQRQLNEIAKLNNLIAQINVIELPYNVLVSNALAAKLSTNIINVESYVKSIIYRLSKESINEIIAEYIVHNLIEFSPTYCRLMGKKSNTKLKRTLIRKYIEAVLFKATYVYPMCEPCLIDYLNDLSSQYFSLNINKCRQFYATHKSINNRINIKEKPVIDLYVESAEYEQIDDKLTRCKEIINGGY